MAQLVERSLPTLDIRGSNPVVGNIIYDQMFQNAEILKRRKYARTNSIDH